MLSPIKDSIDTDDLSMQMKSCYLCFYLHQLIPGFLYLAGRGRWPGWEQGPFWGLPSCLATHSCMRIDRKLTDINNKKEIQI